jgi:hypothetical protein
MTRSFSLYPPVVAFVVLVVGVALVASVPVALIVAGALYLAGWVALFVRAINGAS